MISDKVEQLANEYLRITEWYGGGSSERGALGTEGLESLKQRIVEFYDGKISEENILLTAGATEAIFLAGFSFIEKGSNVGAFDPYFHQYRSVTRLFNGVFSPVLLRFGIQVQIDRVSFEQVKRKGVKFFWLNNPHNPTGKIFGKSELQEVLNELGSDTIIFSDEVYSHTIYNGVFKSMVDFLDYNVLVADSLSKNFSWPELRVGWIIARSSIIKKITALQGAVLFSLPMLTQIAAETVINTRSGRNIPLLLENSNYVKEHLKPEVMVFPSDGTNYMFLDSPLFIRVEKLCKEANGEFGNLCMPSNIFSMYYKNAIRIKIDVEKSRIKGLVKFINNSISEGER